MLLAATILLEAPLWVAAHQRTGPGSVPRRTRPVAVLAALSLALVARFATAGLWHTDTAMLDRWAGSSPFAALMSHSPDRVAYVVGAVVFLSAAGNAFVRLLLRSTGSLSATETPTEGRVERPPGGGRVIGSIERALIFGLAVAGEATAATLVISAKGILRFAEVRASDDDDVDAVTEYVLVGSLASYTLALAFVPFAVA